MGEANDRKRAAAKAIGLWAVGFFDLMGFQRDLLAADPPPTSATDRQKADLFKALERAVSRRNLLTKGAALVYADNSTRVADAPPLDLYQRLRTVEIKTTGFGDSLFLHGRLDDSRVSTAATIHNIFKYATAAMVSHLGYIGSPVRGGIDVGYGFFEDGQLYSPALARTVILEKKAEYPGILVGGRFRKYLVALHSETSDEKDKRLIEKVIGILVENPNKAHPDTYVLDYLGANSRRDFLAALEPAKVARILKFSFDSLEAAKATPGTEETKKVTGYYSRLLAYVDDRLPVWGINIPSKPSARMLTIGKGNLPKPRR